MICPKCGLEQEERIDCLECGIVFSKFNTLYASSNAADIPKEEPMIRNEIAELQMRVRELNNRLIEVEFEKAERKQLRSDLKNLEQQFRQVQEQMGSGMQKLETSLAHLRKDLDLKIPAGTQGAPPQLDEIGAKTGKLVDNLNRTVDQLTGLWEKTGQNSFQITELNEQMTALRQAVSVMNTQLEGMQKAPSSPEPQTIYEDDIKSIRRNLDELGQFLSNLGRKQ
jgi:chromosome segregation ATPase